MRISEIKQNARAFKSVHSIFQLAKILCLGAAELEQAASELRYNVYTIPKKNGGMRLIEEPDGKLKVILRELNMFLQSCYSIVRPSPVYGFCINASNREPLNIVSNAKRHLAHAYMLNIDLKDFFHQVTIAKVGKVFEQNFNKLGSDTVELLKGLTTYKSRLPMGSPTSPVLSNYALLDFDTEMKIISKAIGYTYTRYADDLTFSSNEPITQNDAEDLTTLIAGFDYTPNPEKIKLFDKHEPKQITGLYIEEGILKLPPEYLTRLAEEIERLKLVKLVENRYHVEGTVKRYSRFEQELMGKLQFARQALGKRDMEVNKLYESFEIAMRPPETIESMHWLDIPYL